MSIALFLFAQLPVTAKKRKKWFQNDEETHTHTLAQYHKLFSVLLFKNKRRRQTNKQNQTKQNDEPKQHQTLRDTLFLKNSEAQHTHTKRKSGRRASTGEKPKGLYLLCVHHRSDHKCPPFPIISQVAEKTKTKALGVFLKENSVSTLPTVRMPHTQRRSAPFGKTSSSVFEAPSLVVGVQHSAPPQWMYSSFFLLWNTVCNTGFTSSTAHRRQRERESFFAHHCHHHHHHLSPLR